MRVHYEALRKASFKPFQIVGLEDVTVDNLGLH